MNATDDQLRAKIRQLLQANAGAGAAALESLGDDADLFAACVLDSFGMVMLLDVLATEFAIQIPGDELRPENFASVSAIAELVKRTG